MMQATRARRRQWIPICLALVFALGVLADWGGLHAADRATLLLPLETDAAGESPPAGRYADEAFGSAVDGWNAYLRVWKSHHENPADTSIRRFLGLPLNGSRQLEARRGRSSPRWLGWRSGTFAQVDTPHFTIYSRAGEEPSRRLAEDLEKCYWAWTQTFFPLWEGAPQVATALAAIPASEPIADSLKDNNARITIRRKLQVVLFRDAQEYRQTLERDVPGIERSTGYYDESRQATFLYADENDDAATRRHELVHQLFREATRSGLGRSSPGEGKGFWLVEGIAGYFESMHVDQRIATVGGWDSPRLQFARYRVITGGDLMPVQELFADGRDAAQQRQDLARWYAHAIAQTHHLLDGGEAANRQWIYHQLAELYKIPAALPPLTADVTIDRWESSLRDFLLLTDEDLIDNPSRADLQQLCLAGCEVTTQGLLSITPSSRLQWLDLSRVPADTNSVTRLAPQPESLEQLSLEATRIDADLISWLERADNLRELDLSWTPLGDDAIRAIAPASQLNILWMTGTKVSDDAVALIGDMPELQSLDVQRSGIGDAALDRLRVSRSELEINPLELRSP